MFKYICDRTLTDFTNLHLTDLKRTSSIVNQTYLNEKKQDIYAYVQLYVYNHTTIHLSTHEQLPVYDPFQQKLRLVAAFDRPISLKNCRGSKENLFTFAMNIPY